MPLLAIANLSNPTLETGIFYKRYHSTGTTNFKPVNKVTGVKFFEVAGI